jgi:photosystem II stability/assembly factor-like uncharacterized protein
VYVGTGSDGLRSNVILGKGVYKSSDEGKTWQYLGLEKVGNIGALLVHPEDPLRVWVAAIGNPFAPNKERGIYRTTDGGESWQKTLFKSERTGFVDLEFAPDNPDQIYAAAWQAERKPWTIVSGGYEGGIYRSQDGGGTWKQLSAGLPEGLIGKIDFAVSAADPDRIYALVEAPAKNGGIYRSDDRGDNWTQATDFQPIRNRPFYYTNLEAHPKNPDILWAMAEGFWKSEDAGKTWKRNSTPHGDNHDMWINPEKPEVFIQANDGGANITLDGGETWSTQNNQPTAELYQVDVSDDFPYRLHAGQQDNSTISVPSLPPLWMPGGPTALWEAHGGCETGPAVPKPGDPDVVYANCKGRFGVYNRRTGQEKQYYVGFWNLYGRNPKDLEFRFQRVAPIHVSPHNPDHVYHGSQFLHVTEDGGQTWQTISPDLTAFRPETQVASGSPITRDITGEEHFSTIYEIQESPHEKGVIWVGANDGPIHLTRNGGESWDNVTPKKLGPFGRVQTIEVSPHDPAKAYAAVLRYQLGDFEPYAFRTTDYGKSWTRITTGKNGIPVDYPIRVVREDPDREGLLYAGTEFGMFLSFDDGKHWQTFQLNLPVTPITDIKVVQRDLVLSTMGRSFWIMDDLTPLHEVSPETSEDKAHLFAIRDAYRLHVPGRSWRNPPPFAPRYPRVGANLDYFLSVDGSNLVLEILDSSDQVIRRFESESAGDKPTGSGPAARAKLPNGEGMHRFVWDLRFPGPWNKASGEAPRSGPMVPPGEYRAHLTIDSWSATRSFNVRMDPRVLAEGVTEEDVGSQIELALEVRDVLTEAHQLTADLEKRAKEITEQGEPAEELEAVLKQLVAHSVRYSPPMLLDQLSYLFTNLVGADQRPGKDAYDRLAVLKEELRRIQASAETIQD